MDNRNTRVEYYFSEIQAEDITDVMCMDVVFFVDVVIRANLIAQSVVAKGDLECGYGIHVMSLHVYGNLLVAGRNGENYIGGLRVDGNLIVHGFEEILRDEWIEGNQIIHGDQRIAGRQHVMGLQVIHGNKLVKNGSRAKKSQVFGEDNTREIQRLEGSCKVCDGKGWYETCDDGITPMQEPCMPCKGTGWSDKGTDAKV